MCAKFITGFGLIAMMSEDRTFPERYATTIFTAIEMVGDLDSAKLKTSEFFEGSAKPEEGGTPTYAIYFKLLFVGCDVG